MLHRCIKSHKRFDAFSWALKALHHRGVQMKQGADCVNTILTCALNMHYKGVQLPSLCH